MVAAQEIERALIEGLDQLALQCNEDPRSSRDWHIVRDFNATNASQCESLAGAQILADDGFRPDLYKSFKALARDALHRDDSPREAVVASLKTLRNEPERPERLRWLYEYVWLDIDPSQRARLASMSISWIARLSAALGQPDMSSWVGGVPVKWQFPDRGLRLEATIDATTHDGKVVLEAPLSGAAEDKAAYAAVIYAAAKRSIPESIVLVDPSRRAVRTLSISEVVERGVRTAEAAARAVITSSSGSPRGLGRSPSYFSCRSCPGLEACTHGQDWLSEPVTTRGGMRAL